MLDLFTIYLFGFKDNTCDLIVLVPEHCFSFELVCLCRVVHLKSFSVFLFCFVLPFLNISYDMFFLMTLFVYLLFERHFLSC